MIQIRNQKFMLLMGTSSYSAIHFFYVFLQSIRIFSTYFDNSQINFLPIVTGMFLLR